MSKVVTTTLLPDVAGGSVTLGGTGDSVVVTGNDIRTNVLQDAGGNAVFTSDGSGVLSGMNSAFAGALNLIQSQTASNSASISFTSGLDSTYDVYIFKYYDVNPATDGAKFQFQGSIDSGSNYNVAMTTTFFRANHLEDDSSTAASLSYSTGMDQGNGTAYQTLAQDMGNDADASAAGELFLFNPSNTTYVKHWYSKTQFYYYSSGAYCHFAGGYFNDTNDIDAVSFKMDSGNMDAVIKMYGISKS
jgi:hypothetical protein